VAPNLNASKGGGEGHGAGRQNLAKLEERKKWGDNYCKRGENGNFDITGRFPLQK